ncbi:MAG: hypothetical protein GF383_06865 [Candidatus Lokiarchaeota archaeon]|nr:hypothetical protein [Candidatus Lokiarchaeota archaeon]
MFEMFEIVLIIAILWISSFIVGHIVFGIDLGPFKTPVMILAFVGVVFHELAHAAMSLLVGSKPREFHVSYRSRFSSEPSPQGKVRIETRNLTFLQAALIGLAPAILSTWLFLFSLEVALTETVAPFTRIACALLCVSIWLALAPSKQDLWITRYYFGKNPRYSLYQISLLVGSGIIVWYSLFAFGVSLPIDILFYIMVGIGYYALKYGLIGARMGISKFLSRNPFKLRDLAKSPAKAKRKRFKPSKPEKIGQKRAQW